MTRKTKPSKNTTTDAQSIEPTANASADICDAAPVEDARDAIGAEGEVSTYTVTQWTTAFHEAGHAVAAISLGRSVERVTIVPGKTDVGIHTLGRCHLQKGRATKDWLEDEMIILFAGMVAEARVTGEYCTAGARQDLLAIRRLVTSRFEGERQIERQEKRCLDKTEHLISEAWETVTAVAKELVVRQTISSRGLKHLCRQTQLDA